MAEGKTFTTAQIREDFLKFFESKGSKRVASSSLIPDDPSLLLTNAGMNQFKQYYLGKATMAEIGATTCQKCLRTNDIENIGDATHLSFFEMLGNFAFGGYDKRQACEWAYEFVSSPEYLGLDPDRLWFTIFEDDDDAFEIWREIGVPAERIGRLGADDNFWAAGPTGPCGPCSEIHVDLGEEYGCGREDCAPGCDHCDRFVEIWNLVFTQYDRQEDGTDLPLPHQNIDTGMGLERIAAIMQGKLTNYEGDVLRGLIALGEKLSGKTYGEQEARDRSLRILADHSRAVTFMIADGILPGNEGRSYVLRRLLRRAVFHGRMLGIEGAFLNEYAREITAVMGDVYPELRENASMVEGIIAAEEEHFTTTLETGRGYLDAELAELEAGAELPGERAFVLHDTYGFPIDLTVEIAEAAGYGVDLAGFDACMEEQRERARAAANREAWGTFNDVWVALSDKLDETGFVGYETEVLEDARVLALVVDGEEVERAEAGDVVVVLDRTPFYSEKGGQVGDAGELVSDSGTLSVSDTQIHGEGVVGHTARVESGSIAVGESVCARVDHARRSLIRRNHTATHLLDSALKEVLGEHVNQAGSLVSPERLRFDFTHFEALSAEQIARIEELVNREISAAKPVVTREMALEDARKTGAVALFGEKYGDEVRVVSVGEEETPFSRELCGGTHVSNSAEIGLFKIVSEGSVGSNARRIEALTSTGALEYLDERSELLEQASAALKCPPTELLSRIEGLVAARREAEQKLKNALAGASSDVLSAALDEALALDGYTCVCARLDGMEAAELRSAWDSIRDKVSGPAACVLASATPDGKVALIAAATDEAASAGFVAGKLIGQIAEHVGGRGGGRPTMAQAGGSDPAGIDAALDAARALLTA